MSRGFAKKNITHAILKLPIKKLPPKKIASLLVFIFLLLLLPFSINLVKKVQYFFGQAFGQKANIIIDVSIDQGNVNPFWQALAQGGEEKNPFDNIIGDIAILKPKYIRLDHIYDFYNVVNKENGKLVFKLIFIPGIATRLNQKNFKKILIGLIAGFLKMAG